MARAMDAFRNAAAEAVRGLLGPEFYELGELESPAAALLLAHALVSLGQPILVLAPGARRAEELAGDLRVVLGEEEDAAARRVYYFPAWDILPYEGALPDRELVGERLAALAALGSREPCIVVATVASALQRTLPVGHEALRVGEVAQGQTWERDELVAALLGAGFRRVDLVEEVGECAVRGGIVDVYPPRADLPARVELDGDQVSSLRAFDPVDQRSVGLVSSVRLLPVREDGLAGPIQKDAEERLMSRALEVGMARSRAKELIERLKEGQPTEETAFVYPSLPEEWRASWSISPPKGASASMSQRSFQPAPSACGPEPRRAGA